MKVLWCDTETTGLKTENSAAFQIAMLYKHGADKKKTWERLFFLNPLDEEKGILYHDDAYKTHGERVAAFEKRTFKTRVRYKPENTDCAYIFEYESQTVGVIL